MQPYSDYEIAQRRIQERQTKKNQFRVAAIFTCTPILITLLGNDNNLAGGAGGCLIALAILSGLFTIAHGIELYYTAPSHSPDDNEVEQEIAWLLGDDWQDLAGTQVYALAQDRILKRRMRRWRFVVHALLFVPINGAIFISTTQWIASLSTNSTDFGGFLILLFCVIWTVIFINDARSTFPSKKTLAQREVKYGQTLQLVLSRLQATIPKQKEKLKRGKNFELGDDGELVEVEDEIMRLEDKPKREMDNR